MYCPFCSAEDTKVIDSRLAGLGKQVRRRRECLTCAQRFTTYESAELGMPYVAKRDGRRSPFNEEKLRAGLQKALEKRPISVEQLESTLQKIMYRARSLGEREIASKVLGEIVMEELRALDHVAYVRFASVYRSFEDINAFRDALNKLEEVK